MSSLSEYQSGLTPLIDRLVVLNHAFQKKTQKTPKKEIKIAEERKKDYLSRR